MHSFMRPSGNEPVQSQASLICSRCLANRLKPWLSSTACPRPTLVTVQPEAPCQTPSQPPPWLVSASKPQRYGRVNERRVIQRVCLGPLYFAEPALPSSQLSTPIHHHSHQEQHLTRPQQPSFHRHRDQNTPFSPSSQRLGPVEQGCPPAGPTVSLPPQRPSQEA